MTYFVRVNGDTLHNDPSKPNLYVKGEPPLFPATAFNALDHCFRNDIVRIGWPDTGDLRSPGRKNALAGGYNENDCKPHHREYLKSFVNIQEKSIILVPDKNDPGSLYIAQVTQPYYYFYEIPLAPYEYAHRVGVRWIRDSKNKPVRFQSKDLNIGTRGGFWARAFHVLDETPSGQAALPFIEKAVEKYLNC